MIWRINDCVALFLGLCWGKFWWFGPGYLSAIIIYFHSLTFVEMSGVLILIEGNELSAQSKVTLISPVGLKVKLKTISGLRMPTDWQFTSIITIL